MDAMETMPEKMILGIAPAIRSIKGLGGDDWARTGTNPCRARSTPRYASSASKSPRAYSTSVLHGNQDPTPSQHPWGYSLPEVCEERQGQIAQRGMTWCVPDEGALEGHDDGCPDEDADEHEDACEDDGADYFCGGHGDDSSGDKQSLDSLDTDERLIIIAYPGLHRGARMQIQLLYHRPVPVPPLKPLLIKEPRSNPPSPKVPRIQVLERLPRARWAGKHGENPHGLRRVFGRRVDRVRDESLDDPDPKG